MAPINRATLAILFFLWSHLSAIDAQSCGKNRRRPWRDLSCAEQHQYLEAVQSLKDEGTYDEFVHVHWDSGDWAHSVEEFLPWHRWFLFVFEQELQRVSGSCITIPYWDWERGDSLDIMLKSWTFGTWNGGGCVDDGLAATWDVAEDGRRCLQREYNNDWDFSRDAEVLSRITNNEHFHDFAQSIEGAPHAGPHEYIGGQMSNNWSPDDPIFWLHHSTIDRIFAIWQDYMGHDEVWSEDDFGWEHFSGDLDEPLVFVQGWNVDFNRPGRSRPPTPRELLFNVGGYVDVQYANDSLARLLLETSRSYWNGGHNPEWISASVEDVSERCRTSDSDDDGFEDESSCTENGEWCESRNDCCSGFCSPNSGLCARICSGVGKSCHGDDECCSNTCNRFGRCENGFNELVQCLGLTSKCTTDLDCCSGVCRQPASRCVEPEPTQPVCLPLGDRCDDGGECCSGYCSSRRCWTFCFERGSRCNGDDECCSGDCNQFGRCQGVSRRSLEETYVLIKDEPLVFSSPKMRHRWYELITDYPDNPGQLWAILASEDCSDRSIEKNGEIKSASPNWMKTMFRGNNTQVFDCHFIK